MKKSLKKISTVLISIALLFAMIQPVVFAKGNIPDLDNLGGNEMDNQINSVAGTVIKWIWGLSIVVAVIVLMIIGLKFIVGSTQEKAKYKESLIPLVVGIIILVFATTIVRFLFSIG